MSAAFSPKPGEYIGIFTAGFWDLRNFAQNLRGPQRLTIRLELKKEGRQLRRHFYRSASRKLVCKSFNYEGKRVRLLDPGCINLLLGRRIFKSLCFLDAVECDYDQARRRISI